MVTSRTPTLGLLLGCLVLCILRPHSVSGSAEGEDEIIETLFVGGRYLLQDVEPCTHDWEGDNWTVLTSNCPYNITPNYDKKRCCEYGLGGMLCPYLSLVENTTQNDCAKRFFATLSIVARDYNSNFFSMICTDPNSPLGIECPKSLLGDNTAPSSSRNFSPGSRSFCSYLLLIVALLEILVLIF